MPPDDREQVLLNPGAEGFVPLGRPRIDSRPAVVVQHDGPAIVELEIGLGEPNTVRSVLTIRQLGTFNIPDVVPAGALVSVRGLAVSPSGTSVTVIFHPASRTA